MIIINNGGINWCWYQALEHQDNGLYREVWKERFHRFNPDQGSEDHPIATHSEIFTFTSGRNRSPNWPADWVRKEQVRFVEECRVRGHDPEMVECLIKLMPKGGNETIVIAVARK